MNQLTRVLAQPERLPGLSLSQWDDLMRFARHAGMLGTLHELAKQHGCLEQVPHEARELMESSLVYAEYMQRIARYELGRLAVLFQDASYPLVLLKGAAYLLADLPPAAGRRLNDIDLLVPRSALVDAEGRLRAAGWKFPAELEEYDLRYYREWTHELPPMRHPASSMELDLHHSLIQPTGRIRLDPDLLFESLGRIPACADESAASPRPATLSRFAVLSPQDMYLHSATHLFMSDELRGGLRDLYDMHRLGLFYGDAIPYFWRDLVSRARQLDMSRPLYYAVASMRELFDTAVPDEPWCELQRAAPGLPARKLMRDLTLRHLAPRNPDKLRDPLVEWLLYVRSHWVRMPPPMLVRHLLTKWWMRRQQRPGKTESPGVET